MSADQTKVSFLCQRISDKIFETNPSRLAELFKLERNASEPSPDDLRDSFEHLLSKSFEAALNQLPRELAENYRQLAARLGIHAAAQHADIWTFGELLKYPKPPIVLLTFAKEFAKVIYADRTAWHLEAGFVLYYASLGVALVRLGVPIGDLSDEQIAKGIQKLLAYPWLDSATKHLLKQAQKHLQTEA